MAWPREAKPDTRQNMLHGYRFIHLSTSINTHKNLQFIQFFSSFKFGIIIHYPIVCKLTAQQTILKPKLYKICKICLKCIVQQAFSFPVYASIRCSHHYTNTSNIWCLEIQVKVHRTHCVVKSLHLSDFI